MSPDRYGEPQPPKCRNPNCHKGWLGQNKEGLPIPCLECKSHLLKGTSTTNDSARTTPSASAQEAIDAENQQSRKPNQHKGSRI